LSEYYILAAQAAHGYPEGHHSIALLNMNAGCIRLLSTGERYGNAAMAEGLLTSALVVARQGGSPGAFRNAATFYAVQGYIDHARSIVKEGYDTAITQYEKTRAGPEPAWPGSRDMMVGYYWEMAQSMRRINATITAFTPRILLWALQPPVVGDTAESRMGMLGLDCYMELLWW